MLKIVFKALTSVWERKLPMFFFVLWNRLLLYLSGVEYGADCKICNKIYFTHSGDFKIMRIGDGFVMTSGGGWNPLTRGQRAHVHIESGGELVIGNNVGMSSPTIWCARCITIGDNTKVGACCMIMDTDCHSLDYIVRREEYKISKDLHNNASVSPVLIGQDVMIGANVTILKGVTIGDRAIIGACSVVTKDVPSDCIAAGNPAKVLARRDITI